MRISRHYMPQSLAASAQLTLQGETAHYLGRVLRVRVGDRISLFNARDGEFRAEVLGVSKKELAIQLHEQIPNYCDPALAVHLGMGLSRGERMDIAIQKATELGASSITPLFTERCEVRLDAERAEKRTAHWQKVAISASEQCGRCAVPEINSPQPLQDWLQLPRQEDCFVLDHRNSGNFPAGDKIGSGLVLLTGPEGGLTADEVDAALAAGFQPIQLGPRVLRTETAPLAALSIVQHRYGDM